MNYRLILINSLLLLFWERKLEGEDLGAKELVRGLLADIKGPKQGIDNGGAVDVYTELLELTRRLCVAGLAPMDKSALIRTLRTIGSDDSAITDIIIAGIEENHDDDLKAHVFTLFGAVRQAQKRFEFKAMVNDLARSYVYSEREFNLEEAAQALIERAETYAVKSGEDLDAVGGMVRWLNFDSVEDIKDLFTDAVNEISPDEILKWGWQGLNRLFGKQGGGRRGECCVVGALPHHGKSYMTMAMMRGAARYTIPKPKNPNKRPTMVWISAENDLTVNMRILYEQCYISVYKEKPDVSAKNFNIEEAATFIRDYFAENGWQWIACRIDPDRFCFNDYLQLLNTVETKFNGEIFMVLFDYLAMISKAGIEDSGITGRQTQALWKRARNVATTKHHFFLSPHQLSTEARAIERDRPNKFLDEILERQFYAECKTISNEVDVEINIQKQGDYLNIGWGKHRGVHDTPHKDKRFTRQFHETLGIEDDVLGEDMSLEKPGNSLMNDDNDDWLKPTSSLEGNFALQ